MNWKKGQNASILAWYLVQIMKSIGIVTDSHSGITPELAEKLGIRVLSMPFYIENECFYENLTLTRETFFEKLAAGADVSTSQPSPADVMEIWDEALQEYETILHLPLSSGLSGSCEAAMALAQEKRYRNRVFVVDNGRVSALQHRSVLDAIELIKEGFSAEEIKEILERSRSEMVIYVAVETLEHLKRGGRISPATASIGTLLHVKPVLKFDIGTLDSFKNCRGFVKARKTMLEAVQTDLETTFKTQYEPAWHGADIYDHTGHGRGYPERHTTGRAALFRGARQRRKGGMG